MWYKKPSSIIIITAFAIMCLSFALLAVWEGFSFFAALAICVMLFMALLMSRKRYKTYKRNVKEQRYTDAYMYAEEMGDLSLIHVFKYPKEKERRLKAELRSRLLLYLSCIGGFIMSFSLLIYILTSLFEG